MWFKPESALEKGEGAGEPSSAFSVLSDFEYEVGDEVSFFALSRVPHSRHNGRIYLQSEIIKFEIINIHE